MARKKAVELREDVLQEDESPDEMHADNVANLQTKPSNRVEAMNTAINLLGMLPKDTALNCIDQMLNQIGHEADLVGDNSAKNQAGIMGKPSFASPRMTESIKEAISDIFGEDTQLSEEFKEKVTTLFESALGVRVALEREAMQAELEEAAEAELNEALEGIVQHVDQYVTHAAEEWLKENQVAIETSLQSEITEELIADLRAVFEAHNIVIPEGKVDAAEALAARVEELETKLNDAMNENMELVNSLSHYAMQEIADEVSEGLALTQKEKFYTLIEGVEFDDPENYAKKLAIVKSKHFGGKTVGQSTGILQEDVMEVPETDEIKTNDPNMKRYMDVITHVVQK